MKNKGLIKYIVIIAVILTVVFLSQQPIIKGNSSVFKFPLLERGSAYFGNSYVLEAGNWLKNSTSSLKNAVSAKIGSYLSIGNKEEEESLQSPQQPVEEGIEVQNNAVPQSSADVTRKFIAEKFLQMIRVAPEQLNSSQPQCQCQN